MARKNVPPPAPGAVPAWFMTYSDTITLLMTFFILLLTFATSEPERFQQMKIAVFGSIGSAGVAGKNNFAEDRENFVVRYRPPSARMTSRGSESPLEDGPIIDAVAKGLKSLDDEEALADARHLEFDAPLQLLRDEQGKPSSYTLQRLRMIAVQMRHNTFTLKLTVPDERNIPFAVLCGNILMSDPQILPARISVSHQSLPDLPESHLRFTILQDTRLSRTP